MNSFYTNLPEAQELVRKAFPGYKGKTIQVCQFHGPMRLDSYWSGGSRDYYAIMNMSTGQQITVQENGNGFSNDGKVEVLNELPLNGCVIQYTYGNHDFMKIYVNEVNFTKMLPAPAQELTYHQKAVLIATTSYKSFARYENLIHYVQITKEQYETTKQELIALKLLNKAGAITNEGRNIAQNHNLHSLSKE